MILLYLSNLPMGTSIRLAAGSIARGCHNADVDDEGTGGCVVALRSDLGGPDPTGNHLLQMFVFLLRDKRTGEDKTGRLL